MEGMDFFLEVFPHFEDQQISMLQEFRWIQAKPFQGKNETLHFLQQTGVIDLELDRNLAGHGGSSFGKISSLQESEIRAIN